MAVIHIVSALLILAAIGVAYRRLDARLLNLKESRSGVVNMHFRQIEALAALYYRLRPAIPFPLTRGWAASPDFLLTVAEFIFDRRPLTVVECSSGVSTVISARCMQLIGAGHVYSLEHDKVFAQRTRVALEQHGLSRFATVIDAPLTQTDVAQWSGRWYDSKALENIAIDLLIVDGPPQSSSKLARYPSVPALISKFAEGAVVLLDDADRVDEQAIAGLWLERFGQLREISVGECEKGCRAFLHVPGAV